MVEKNAVSGFYRESSIGRCESLTGCAKFKEGSQIAYPLVDRQKDQQLVSFVKRENGIWGFPRGRINRSDMTLTRAFRRECFEQFGLLESDLGPEVLVGEWPNPVSLDAPKPSFSGQTFFMTATLVDRENAWVRNNRSNDGERIWVGSFEELMQLLKPMAKTIPIEHQVTLEAIYAMCGSGMLVWLNG